MDSPDVDLLAWAKDLASVSAAALRLGDSMGVIFSHHIRDAIERQRVTQAGVSERSLHRLAVGWRTRGFTPLSMHTSPSELLELVGAFEVKAFEVASAHNGRIVKHIGNEVDVHRPRCRGRVCDRARYHRGIRGRYRAAWGRLLRRRDRTPWRLLRQGSQLGVTPG